MALQTVRDGRQFLKYVDARLGVPLPERDYGGNCLIYDPDKTDPFHNVWVRVPQGLSPMCGVSFKGLPVHCQGGLSQELSACKQDPDTVDRVGFLCLRTIPVTHRTSWMALFLHTSLAGT